MPRKKKGKSQTTAQSPTGHAPQAFTAKCVQCEVRQELQACDICDRPKCATCVKKHREEEKLSQINAALESKIGLLRQQTDCKQKLIENGLKELTTSFDLLKVTFNEFIIKLKEESDTHEKILAESKICFEEYLNELKRLWTELESITDDYALKEQMVNQIELFLIKKHVQPRFEANPVLPKLGSVNESSQEIITASQPSVSANVKNTPATNIHIASSGIEKENKVSKIDYSKWDKINTDSSSEDDNATISTEAKSLNTLANNNASDKKQIGWFRPAFPITSLSSIANNASSMDNRTIDIESNMFIVKRSPVIVEGYGMYAQCDLAPGSVILSEKPFFECYCTDDIEKAAQAIEQLDEDKRELFHRLRGNTIDDILRTHVIPFVFDKDLSQMGLFPSLSFVNHSCNPNAFCHWFPKQHEMRLFANRQIAAGEQIFVSYLNRSSDSPEGYYVELVQERQERQSWLKKNFYFECKCEICEKQLTDHESNQQWKICRENFQKLRTFIVQASSGNVFYKLAHLCEAISIYRQMIIFTSDNLCLTYFWNWMAAQASAAISINYEETIKYLKTSMDLKIKIEGDDVNMESEMEIARSLPPAWRVHLAGYIYKYGDGTTQRQASSVHFPYPLAWALKDLDRIDREYEYENHYYYRDVYSSDDHDDGDDDDDDDYYNDD